MSMNKGMDALALVFTMFILIVVTLVVIKIFTGMVSENALPKIDDIKDSYNYDKEKNNCASLCGRFTASDCADLEAATTFCQHQVSISIDGNFKPGEKGHFGIIAKQPRCEDGMYCFDVYNDCGCGSYLLDDANCRDMMLDYYRNVVGYSEETAKNTICKALTVGTCNPDPRKWSGKRLPQGYQYQPALGTDAQYGIGDPPVIGADYWWKRAGYGAICNVTNNNPAEYSFACSKTDATTITCSWSGCPAGEQNVLALQQVGGGVSQHTFTEASGNWPFGGLAAGGNYRITISCDGHSDTVTVPL